MPTWRSARATWTGRSSAPAGSPTSRRPAWSSSASAQGPGDIPRADVAAVLAAVLDNPATAGKQWNVVSGDTPVGDAVHALPD